jgi:hypothetical protein
MESRDDESTAASLGEGAAAGLRSSMSSTLGDVARNRALLRLLQTLASLNKAELAWLGALEA